MTHRRIMMAIALLGMVGCSRPRVELLKPPQTPVVWPKEPDRPRIRLLGELRTSEDLQPSRTIRDVWEELLYGPRKPWRLISPYAVAVHADGARVAIADTGAACVHIFDLERRTYANMAECGPEADRLGCPVGVAWAGDILYVADSSLRAVAAFGPTPVVQLIGRQELKRPAGLSHCAANDFLYVTDAGAHAVLAFDRRGHLAARFGSRGSAPGEFNVPSHIACGPDGTIAVADSLNFRIQQFGPDGSPRRTFGTKGDAPGDFALPKGVAYDPDGNLWVVDAQFENVQGFDREGRLLMAFGQEGTAAGEFSIPAGICIDARRRIWIADTYNQRVQVFELLP